MHRVHAFFRIDPRVRGFSGHHQVRAAYAFALCFQSPFGAKRRLENQHRVASRASASMVAREASLPISSSDVQRNTKFLCTGAPAARNASTAKSASTSPPFMSNAPGPKARPPETRNGVFASVPAGYTVSRCPITKICPSVFAPVAFTEIRRLFPRSFFQNAHSCAAPFPLARYEHPESINTFLVVAERFAAHEFAEQTHHRALSRPQFRKEFLAGNAAAFEAAARADFFAFMAQNASSSFPPSNADSNPSLFRIEL